MLYLGAVISNLHDTISTTTYTRHVSSASDSPSKERTKGRRSREKIVLFKGPGCIT